MSISLKKRSYVLLSQNASFSSNSKHPGVSFDHLSSFQSINHLYQDKDYLFSIEFTFANQLSTR